MKTTRLRDGGRALGRPRESVNNNCASFGRRGAAAAFLSILLAGGCQPLPEIPEGALRPVEPRTPYTVTQALKEFDAAAGDAYRLGEGDALTLQVWDRPDLSGSQVVGPDGAITIPVVGTLKVTGMTRDEAAKTIKESLAKFYSTASVTVRVDQYLSNRVLILGRVQRPGVLQFENVPTLLEALARAGGLVVSDRPTVTHCAVVRGRDSVAWLDLRRILDQGDLTLNLRLKANDLLFIPEWEEQPVYVLGQVARPGLVRWRTGMSFLDAVAQAGGTTRDASPSRVLLIRPSQNFRAVVPLDDLLQPLPGSNLALQQGDIVYVPTNLLADVGYVLEKLNPFGWVFLARGVK